MYGNKIIAIAFKRKIRLIEATKSSLFALMIGAREAMAVPPQIAVPETNKRVRLWGNRINFPIKIPNIMIAMT